MNKVVRGWLIATVLAESIPLIFFACVLICPDLASMSFILTGFGGQSYWIVILLSTICVYLSFKYKKRSFLAIGFLPLAYAILDYFVISVNVSDDLFGTFGLVFVRYFDLNLFVSSVVVIVCSFISTWTKVLEGLPELSDSRRRDSLIAIIVMCAVINVIIFAAEMQL